jgi:hypothetical protein
MMSSNSFEFHWVHPFGQSLRKYSWHERLSLKLSQAALSAVFASLTGCALDPSPPDPASHSDMQTSVSYVQFVGNAKGETPISLAEFSPQVRAECMKIPPAVAPPKAGGVNILASVATALIGSIATDIVNELKKWVSAEVAKYSVTETGKPTHVQFYSDANWFSRDGSSERYSCFAIGLAKCAKSSQSEDGQCSSKDLRIVIIGQYRLTNEYLQVRTLAASVLGFGAKRGTGDASIAATLKVDSAWWDGHEGHQETLKDMKVLSAKFTATADDAPAPEQLKIMSVHKAPDGKVTLSFPSWETQDLLPRPPQSPNSEGTVTITPTIAEANKPPGGLDWLNKFLGSNSADISIALKTALGELVPKAPATPAPKK